MRRSLLTKITDGVSRAATGRTALVAAACAIAFLVPYFAIPYKALLAKGILIDQTFNFSNTDVHRILTSYTADERAQYVRAEIVDLFVPLVTIFVAIIIAYAWKRMGWKNNIVLIPLAAGVFNDLKTLLMFPIIMSYPHESTPLIILANAINMIKIPLLGLSVLLLVVAIGVIIFTAARGPIVAQKLAGQDNTKRRNR